MGSFALVRYAVTVGAAATLLAGCGAPLGPGAGPVPLSQAALSAPLGDKLLYASSIYNCDVYAFSYPRGMLVQTLNICGFGSGPAFGLCTDKAGDVFMAMGDGTSIFEFAHGGTKPIAQLDDGSLLPLGCSVDAKTGDLGVASAEGNVAIFKNASGKPQTYSLPGISEFFFCTFDDRGNLFADGEHSDNSFALAELPKGGSALREITLDGDHQPGYALQWDGRHVALGATQGSAKFVLDRIRVSGSVAKVVGTTKLEAVPNNSGPFQFWIQNHTVIQPENGNAELGFWDYPSGGSQTKGIPIGGSSLVGVTVSVKPRR